MPQVRTVLIGCHGCGQDWDPALHAACPNCGPGKATLPECIWEISHVAGSPFSISANVRNRDRLMTIAQDYGIRRMLDVSDDPQQRWTWRPDPLSLRESGMYFIPVDGLKDHATEALDYQVMRRAVGTALSMTARGHRMLIACAAGLRRAPHVTYACLIARGHEPGRAWEMIQAARPFVHKIDHYAEVAEDVGRSLFLARS